MSTQTTDTYFKIRRRSNYSKRYVYVSKFMNTDLPTYLFYINVRSSHAFTEKFFVAKKYFAPLIGL